MSVAELKQYILKSKYARHNKEARRRETYDEAVNRVRGMMHVKYEHVPDVHDLIDWAYDEVLKETALGSQRAMQYGGDPILNKNARIYNCTSSYANRLRFFQEAFWLLLCGCGVGFSVQFHHVAQLPAFAGPQADGSDDEWVIYTIPDTIEGWADSLGVLLSCYFPGGPFPEYFGKFVTFDPSRIRPKGSPLSSGAGRAPGPEPLMTALHKIRTLIDDCIRRGQTRFRPIDVYDIIMFASDAVLAGGVRRSATICVFSPDDEEMATAKTGDWLALNRQRARSNNSALLVRSDTSFEQFSRLMEHTKSYGEPGFVWADSTELLPNPCQPPWAKVLTPDGIRTIGEITEGDRIWSGEGWTTVLRKWSTGNNEVYRYGTTAGVFYGTSKHRVISNGVKIAAEHAESIDILTGPHEPTACEHDVNAVMDGLVIGDGSVHKASNDLVYLGIGRGDHDYFEDRVACLIGEYRPGLADGAYEVTTSVLPRELPHTYNRRVPDRFLRGDVSTVRSFLRGLFSANGSVCGDRVTLKASSFGIVEDVQLMLSAIGIRSYHTTNKPKTISFSNGEYACRQSYDVNITSDREKFFNQIGFIQKYKMDRLKGLIQQKVRSSSPKTTYDIVSVDLVSVEETFDITVDNSSHTYWTHGCNVSNCIEISFYAHLLMNKSDPDLSTMLAGYSGPVGHDSPEMVAMTGFQMCNLSTINGGRVETASDFYRGGRVAAVLGTLQAGFAEFPYLGRVSEEIVRREALLGVSITSIMSNPRVMLDPDVLRRGAEIILQTNAEVAEMIGINPCARGTCIKPEGTGTLMLGSLASGCHGWPFSRGIRNVQANNDEIVYHWFRQYNPQACARSVWCADGSTDVISFPIEAPPGAMLQESMTAVEFLDVVKTLYLNWVVPGRRPERCTQPWLNHNVSNTVKVKPHEWDDVTRHIYEYRSCYAGISLLPWSGDRDYEQAPHVAVHDLGELRRRYGASAVDTVRLTYERVLSAYDGKLWDACRDFESGKIPDDPERAMAYGVADWFANNHLGGDRRRLSYLLKDIFYLDQYEMLKQTFVSVPYEELIEEEDATDPQAEPSCAGGSCSLV
jgi:hypothetical protein